MDDSGRALAEFGLRIRGARTAMGLSQEQLAHQAGLHRTYIGSVERGERNISLLNILTLAAVLGVDPGTLVSGLACAPRDITAQ